MFTNTQLRSLLMALYGLVAMIVLTTLTVAAIIWFMPTTSSPVAASGGNGEGPSPANPVKTAAKAVSADAKAGEEIFTGNCAACHSTGADKLVGPGLAGVRQRTPGEEWLQKWIKNSSALIATGDAYAVKVFNANGKVQMTSYTNLTDQQIKQVLDYVDSKN